MKRAAVLVLGAMMLAPGIAHAAPNDAWYWAQWGLTKIEAARAWTVEEGAGILVAVVDTGVDASHPDLKGRVVAGKDFVDDDTDASDRHGHGTMIAGIIAATTNNGAGIASVAPRARILPVRVLDEDGTGSSQDVASGIHYAMERGAHVINLSLAQDGSPNGGLLGGDLLRDPSVGDAIEDAARAGHLVVVAAGNDRQGGKAQTAYDATVSGSVVVGASTPNDKRAAYSNYGAGLDLLAPGGGSATDASLSGCTQNNSIVSTWWNPDTRRSDYGGGCGTSMSVAFASGVGALLRAQGRSAAQAVNRMLATADDIGSVSQTGAGRLNARRALGASKAPKSTKKSSPSSAPRPRASEVRAQSQQETPPSATASSSASPSPTDVPTADATIPVRPPGPAVVAFPGVSDQQRKGWPVTAASMLVSLMVLAHVLRFLRVARR